MNPYAQGANPYEQQAPVNPYAQNVNPYAQAQPPAPGYGQQGGGMVGAGMSGAMGYDPQGGYDPAHGVPQQPEEEANGWMERARLLEPPVGRRRAPAGVSALCFDAHQEIMWVGRHDGWVSNYEVREGILWDEDGDGVWLVGWLDNRLRPPTHPPTRPPTDASRSLPSCRR